MTASTLRRVAVAGVEHDLDADVAVGCRAQLAVDGDAVGADGSELDHVGAGPLEGDVGEHAHGGHGVVATGNQRLAASGSCTDSSTAPSASRCSMRMPGSPSGVVSISPGVSGAPTVVAPPRCSETSASGKAARSASSGSLTCGGVTKALPPPWVNGLDGVVADEGDAPRAVGAGRDGKQAALVAEHDGRAGGRLGEERDDLVAAGSSVAPLASNGSVSPASPLSAPTRSARRTMRATLSSMTDSGTSPTRTAASRPSAHGPPGPGITRSRPPSAGSTTVFVASQSLITTPSKPHSPLRMPVRSGSCAVAVSSTPSRVRPL